MFLALIIIQLILGGSAVMECDPLYKICKFGSCSLPTYQFQVKGLSYDYSDFNAISFDSFSIENGDVEGRVATMGKFSQVSAQGVSIGDKLNASSLTYSLITNNDITFNDGEIFPLPNSKIFAAGSFSGSSYLRGKTDEVGCGASTGCIDQSFTDMKSYFEATSDALLTLPANTVTSFSGTTFTVDCQGTANVYVISTTATSFNTITGYVLNNCPSDAYFVFNINGNQPISFTGGAFPTSATVYNYPGTGGVRADNAVYGSILAPRSTLTQPTGVIQGQVVASAVLESHQINISHCPAQHGGGYGDPMIIGFNRNLRFWFNGVVGGIFNLYNDQYLNANSRFMQANEKNGTVMEAIAIEVAGHKISFSIKDRHDGESMDVMLNGVKTTVRADAIQHLSGCLELGMKPHKFLSIRTPVHDVKIKFGHPTGDGYITVDHLDFDINPPRKNHRKVGGVIGQTASNKSDRRDESFSVTDLYGTEKSHFYMKTLFKC